MTTLSNCEATSTINAVRTFVDEQTGRTIRQLTDFPKGAHLGYFRMFRQLPDGRMLAWAKHDCGNAILIDAESGDLELLPYTFRSLKFRESDGRNWFLRHKDPDAQYDKKTPHAHELWHIDLPNGEPVYEIDIPEDPELELEDITIDGEHLIFRAAEQDLKEYPIPTTKDVQCINHYFSRPRRGSIWVYKISTGELRKIFESEGICPLHLDTSPADPMLLKYAMDMPDALGQRVWSIRIDGSDRHAIRPQEVGEMVTHEFWWSDPNYIGYTYQDRRQDPTLRTHHWAEYALAQTRLGIAELSGKEVYLSDPINSYHSHLYRSNDGMLVSGEGTDGNSFVYAATFSMDNPKIDLVQMATIHTEYIPFRGQGVDCNFSADGRWLIYADKLEADKPHQLFAVAVDL